MRIYFYIWLFMQSLGLAVMLYQWGALKNHKQVISTLIGILINIPIYVAGYLYIFGK